MERGTCIFDFRCARKGEDTKSIKVLVDVSKMIDKVVVVEKTKCPVDKTEEKKEAWDNPFCQAQPRLQLKLSLLG